MKTFILIAINIIVFTLSWVGLGVLAESIIENFFDNTIIIQAAFAWGALNYILSTFIAYCFEGVVLSIKARFGSEK